MSGESTDGDVAIELVRECTGEAEPDLDPPQAPTSSPILTLSSSSPVVMVVRYATKEE
jgi:hypothetical protein